VRAALEKNSYPFVGFHATGMGDRAMEAMISEGLFRGVIDLAPAELERPVRVHERCRAPPLGSAGGWAIPPDHSTCGVITSLPEITVHAEHTCAGDTT